MLVELWVDRKDKEATLDAVTAAVTAAGSYRISNMIQDDCREVVKCTSQGRG